MGAYALTDDQVRQLRTRRVINGEYMSDLCREFGISSSYGLRIVRGEARISAGGPLEEVPVKLKARRDYKGAANPNAQITAEDRALIRKLVKDGATHRAVADVMMCAHSTVTKIVNEGPQ